MKDIITVLGIDGAVGLIVYLAEPSFLKWVLVGGLASLLALFYFTREGRISIYGTQIVMAIVLAIKFF